MGVLIIDPSYDILVDLMECIKIDLAREAFRHRQFGYLFVCIPADLIVMEYLIDLPA